MRIVLKRRVFPFPRIPYDAKKISVYHNPQLDVLKEYLILKKKFQLIQQVPTLFYPGCGLDYPYIEKYLSEYGIKRFIYVDYLIDFKKTEPIDNDINIKEEIIRFNSRKINKIQREITIDEITKNSHGIRETTPYDFISSYNLISLHEIYPRYFGAPRWKYFWHPNCPKNNWVFSYCLKAIFEVKGNTIEFYYFKTDAVGTYDFLLTMGWNINIVIIGDYGFGAQWTYFCGESILYYLSLFHNKMPDYLSFCSHHGETWPGYRESNSPSFLSLNYSNLWVRS